MIMVHWLSNAMLPARKSIYLFPFTAPILREKNDLRNTRKCGKSHGWPATLVPKKGGARNVPWQQRFSCARNLQRRLPRCTGEEYRKTAHSADASGNKGTFCRHKWLRGARWLFRNLFRKTKLLPLLCSGGTNNTMLAEIRRLCVRIINTMLGAAQNWQRSARQRALSAKKKTGTFWLFDGRPSR